MRRQGLEGLSSLAWAPWPVLTDGPVLHTGSVSTAQVLQALLKDPETPPPPHQVVHKVKAGPDDTKTSHVFSTALLPPVMVGTKPTVGEPAGAQADGKHCHSCAVWHLCCPGKSTCVTIPGCELNWILSHGTTDRKIMVIHTWVYGRYFPKNDWSELVTSKNNL